MTTSAAPATRRLYRRREDRLVAGVASGLADHLGVDVKLLRVGFVATVLLGGFGVVLYAAFWAVVPQSTDDSDRREANYRSQLIGFAVLGVSILLVAQLLGFGPGLTSKTRRMIEGVGAGRVGPAERWRLP